MTTEQQIQAFAVATEGQKTEIVKQIFDKLNLPWTEKYWSRITSTMKDDFSQTLFYNQGKKDEKVLCTFEVKFQEEEICLDVQSKYL